MLIKVIRSGGQSGVDRGALDAARATGFPIAGWCPRGGWAEDMQELPGLLELYPELSEAPSADPAQRTAWNVRDSDATLIVCPGAVASSPGTLATVRFAQELGKPFLIVDGADAGPVLEWLQNLDTGGLGADLNVAGPRESGAPGIYGIARELVSAILAIDSVAADDAGAAARIRLHVLASGSKGNCAIVENLVTGGCIAVDCGISKRAFMERLQACGVAPRSIEAVLVTHEHSDHTKGLGVMMRGLARCGAHPVLFASEAVHRASSELRAIQDSVDLRHFACGDDLALAGMAVHAFATSHDAAESFGFRFDAAGDAVGFMTDTGIATGQAREALKGCRVLAIEANHDPDMLEHGPYPYYLKARIASERGHLSNAQSAALLEELLDDGVRSVIGMHVSQNNNTYRLPRLAHAEILSRNGHPAQVFVAYQDRLVSV